MAQGNKFSGALFFRNDSNLLSHTIQAAHVARDSNWLSHICRQVPTLFILIHIMKIEVKNHSGS